MAHRAIQEIANYSDDEKNGRENEMGEIKEMKKKKKQARRKKFSVCQSP